MICSTRIYLVSGVRLPAQRVRLFLPLAAPKVRSVVSGYRFNKYGLSHKDGTFQRGAQTFQPRMGQGKK